MDSMDEDIMRLIEAVAADPRHQERGVNIVATSWEALKRRRDQVNAVICDRVASLPAGHHCRHVKAWRWRIRSLGSALTDAGRQRGMEIRLSWNTAPQF